MIDNELVPVTHEQIVELRLMGKNEEARELLLAYQQNKKDNCCVLQKEIIRDLGAKTRFKERKDNPRFCGCGKELNVHRKLCNSCRDRAIKIRYLKKNQQSAGYFREYHRKNRERILANQKARYWRKKNGS